MTMSPETIWFAALLALFAGPLLYAFAPAEIAALRRWWTDRRQAAAAWRDGAELVAGLAAITAELPVIARPPWHDVPPRDSSPPCENGRARCRECRLDGDCRDTTPGERTAYAAGHPLPAAGRHDVAVRVAAWKRRLRLAYLRQAVQLDPTTYAWRLGRAVQLGNGHIVGGAA